MENQILTNRKEYEEKALHAFNGYAALFLSILIMLSSIALFVFCTISLTEGANAPDIIMLVASTLLFILSIIALCGLKVIDPQEALVLVLFGKYYGTLKQDGFFWVNPFCTAINPTVSSHLSVAKMNTSSGVGTGSISITNSSSLKKISLKANTLNNEHQKVNDQLGNPIIIGAIVIWRVASTTKAVFNVDNYKTFLSIQCDTAIRNIARLYPYDITDSGSEGEEDEKSLRGSSQEIAEKMKLELQDRVSIAGLEIMEVRITSLSYAPEIAAAMLQRQQAAAIISARQKIVEGAVGMVEMALNKLSENEIVELDDERKAAMVSNLLVVLCGNKDAQPIVNSGSIY